MPLFDAIFFLALLASGFMIMVGAKKFLPSLIKLALPLLVVAALLPCVVSWARGAFDLGVDEVNEIPPEMMGAVFVGHIVLFITLARRWLRAHWKPSADTIENERTRGRERQRLPPRGEG